MAQPVLNHPAPDFSLPRFGAEPASAEMFTLSAVQGTPVVLNFWATWCGPCRREFPALQVAAARHASCAGQIGMDAEAGGDATGDGGRGCVLVVGVNQGEGAFDVGGFLAEMGEEPGSAAGAMESAMVDSSNFPILMDTDFAVGRRYNVRGLPLTYFIDGQGIVRGVWSGEMNSVILAENIAGILP